MTGLRTREAVCLMDGGLAPDQSNCDSGPEPERSQDCHMEQCEEEDLEEEYEEEEMEDFEPEELELQSSTRASPVIVSNEIPPIVPEKYTAAAAASRREDAKFLPPSNSPCEDKFKNCNIVVQAHLCVYSFYQSNCCQSCRDITAQS